MKTVLVSGDSRGVGTEIVKSLLVNNDYRVVGISRKSSEDIEKLQAAFAGRYIHVNYDLSGASGIAQFYKSELKQHGPFYGLVNNAAYAYDDIITNANLKQLETMFTINFHSPVMLTKYIIRDMILNGVAGSLVHITSVCAHTGYKGLSMYSATKGAMEAFSRTAAREWGSKKIRSNCVAPGFMETAMSENLNGDQKERIYQRTSLKEETSIKSVADTVRFLLSEESCSITGQVIHVDNGTI